MVCILYVTWLPAYLQHEKKLSGTALAVFAGLPLLLSVPADLLGGIVSDRFSSRLGLRRGRCLVGFGSLFMAALFLIGGSSCRGVISAVLIGLAAASANFLLGASWAACADIAGDHAATLGAAMNTSGQIGGVLSPIIFALLMRNRVDWSAPLFVTAFLYFVGALCWYYIHPERPFGTDCQLKSEVRQETISATETDTPVEMHRRGN